MSYPDTDPFGRPLTQEEKDAYNGGPTYQVDGNGQLLVAPPGFDGNEYAAMSPAEKLIAQAVGDARTTRAGNLAAIQDTKGQVLPAYRATADMAYDAEQQRLAEQRAAMDTANTLRAGALDRQATASGIATGQDLNTMNALSGVYNGVNNQNNAALGTFTGANANANEYGASLFGNYSNQMNSANTAEANIAKNFGSQVGGIKPVSNIAGVDDVSSVAGGATADPAALAMQRTAAERLLGIASGGADLQSAAANVQADPEAVAAQKRYLANYEALSNPNMTASERYMMERARQQEEQDNRAAMGAALHDLQMRGIRSGGAEIGALLGSSQNTSQNRMLQDMAAQANAQQRAERMMQAGTGLAGDISAQSFGQGLDRAQAQDQFGLANRATAINALGSYAGLGTDIAGQSFNQAYQAGSAADDMSRFNANNSLATQQFNANLQKGQNNDVYNRLLGVTNVQTGAVNDAANRTAGVYQAGVNENKARTDRAGNVLNETQETGSKTAEMGQDFANKALGVDDAYYNRELQGTGLTLGATNSAMADQNNRTSTEGQSISDTYARENKPADALTDLTGMQVGTNTQGAQLEGAQTSKLAGTVQSDAAAKKLDEEKGGLFGGVIIPGLL